MKEVHIYTDGSHIDKQHNGRLGCGGILVIFGKQVDTFGIELSKEFMKDRFGADYCSNPSAELVAIYFALLAFEKHLKNADSIIFHADYQGVMFWMNGTWRIKEPYIKAIKGAIDSEIGKQKLSGKVEYRWVRGHQANPTLGSDAYWNSCVDILAKGKDTDGKN